MVKKGILLIHGFGGGPHEVESSRIYFERKGFEVSVPLLPGHGQTPLKNATMDDWAAAVELSYLELLGRCESVLVVGFSMGGLLAARLWNYQPEGIVTVNTPIHYWNLKQMAKNIREEKEVVKKYRASAGKYSGEALLEFQKLLFDTKAVFSMIRCPVLVIQSADDDVVRPVSANYIFSRVRGDKLMIVFPEGGHQLLQSEASTKVCQAVEQFMTSREAEAI